MGTKVDFVVTFEKAAWDEREIAQRVRRAFGVILTHPPGDSQRKQERDQGADRGRV